ncbi:MAG TPA: leucine--tRNA ligase [Flavobacteriales bacterium]|nr:leucine--tRNA ligase [Flavobacteriales bacterium]
MEYNHRAIQERWQKYWADHQTYRIENDSSRPKYYVLDMFPYPSGSGLHVGHPLGYIASDIIARFKRLQGFNVLHPMGYDAFGLPAEQYAIETGQHPAETTKKNSIRYREQLDKIGFSFDWSREVNTSDPKFYKWTQWIFLQLFDSWYDADADKAKPIQDLVEAFEIGGSSAVNANSSFEGTFTAADWKAMSPKEREDVLQEFRLTFLKESTVNWCPALGTVLANDEVKDGLSERGGHEVVQRKMLQWSMRITAYADRLLSGLDSLEWTDSMKEIQRNWIGRSQGAKVFFDIVDSEHQIEVFTTRPDTMFGASFMVLAPEHPFIEDLCTDDKKEEVSKYQKWAEGRSERERMSEVKEVTGAFTGAYAVNPMNGEKLPIWISDYVLIGYGSGAIMAVPCGDQRDWEFARHFNIPIPNIIEGHDIEVGALEDKGASLCNSGFLNGLKATEAIPLAIEHIAKEGRGEARINYKLREAVFSRQRYWGEPVPIYFEDGIPKGMSESDLPLELPEVDQYLPTEDGDPPLGRAENWVTKEGFPIELNTMPGWAGSSWYFLRYMDPDNETDFVGKEAVDYWGQVDLYVGGAEHSTGHLLYFRFWTKFLFDRGFIPFDEPARKLINQGMIVAEDGHKMSKRYGNVVNPDDIVEQYGADALRLHEMFLGPIEDHKPWNTKGIEGVYRFLKKFWRLYTSEDGISREKANAAELKSLHQCIKKVSEDIERYSLNTCVSTFMICVNELSELKCTKAEILEPLAILISCHAPHIAEEAWSGLGHTESITTAEFPKFNPEFLKEDSKTYPVMFNGKRRYEIVVPADMPKDEVEKLALEHEYAEKWLEGGAPKKVIVVPGKIVNVVL